MFSRETLRWACRQDFLLSPTKVIQKKIFSGNDKNLQLTHHSPVNDYVHTIPSFATFLEAFTAYLFSNHQKQLWKQRTRQPSIRWAPLINRSIYLGLRCPTTPRVSLYFIRHLVLFLFQSQHELLPLISSYQPSLPCLSPSTVTTAAGWAELTYWKRHWCWERLTAGGERDNRQLDGITSSIDMSLSKLW